MRTIADTPTRPANYALITSVYAAALLGVASVGRRTGQVPRGRDLVPLGTATFTFTRVLTEQKVEEWLRRPFVEESGDGTRRPRGRGLRYAVGELLSCGRCTGSWVGLGLVGVHVASPPAARVVAGVGTVGAVNDVALAAFSWLTARANQAAAPAEQASTAAHPASASAERASTAGRPDGAVAGRSAG